MFTWSKKVVQLRMQGVSEGQSPKNVCAVGGQLSMNGEYAFGPSKPAASAAW